MIIGLIPGLMMNKHGDDQLSILNEMRTDRMKLNITDKQRKAFTLIECLTAFTILLVAFLGIMRFRYYTVVNAERAEDELLAARSALLISEAWRADLAELDFDPSMQNYVGDFTVEKMDLSGHKEGVFGADLSSVLGVYKITVDDKEFVARLSCQDVDAVENLRLINVTVIWKDAQQKRYYYRLPTLSQTSV